MVVYGPPSSLAFPPLGTYCTVAVDFEFPTTAGTKGGKPPSLRPECLSRIRTSIPREATGLFPTCQTVAVGGQYLYMYKSNHLANIPILWSVVVVWLGQRKRMLVFVTHFSHLVHSSSCRWIWWKGVRCTTLSILNYWQSGHVVAIILGLMVIPRRFLICICYSS